MSLDQEKAQLIVIMKAIMLQTNMGEVMITEEDMNRAHLGYDIKFNRPAAGYWRLRIEERRDEDES